MLGSFHVMHLHLSFWLVGSLHAFIINFFLIEMGHPNLRVKLKRVLKQGSETFTPAPGCRLFILFGWGSYYSFETILVKISALWHSQLIKWFSNNSVTCVRHSLSLSYKVLKILDEYYYSHYYYYYYYFYNSLAIAYSPLLSSVLEKCLFNIFVDK